MRALVAFSAALVLLSSFALFLNADDPPAEAELPADFGGKVGVITLKSDSEFSFYVQELELRKLAGNHFLVCVQVDDEDLGGWSRGRPTWLSIGDIASVVLFDNVDQLKRAHDEDETFPNTDALREPLTPATPVARTR